jgi:hypothetical protein
MEGDVMDGRCDDCRHWEANSPRAKWVDSDAYEACLLLPEEGEVNLSGLGISRCNALQLHTLDEGREHPVLMVYESFGCIRWEATDG